MNKHDTCFACGARILAKEGETHKYMLSAPGCWDMFNEVLAREYSELMYWKGHQFTVDAYACQHVGISTDKRAMRSVHIHLASLYCMFELGLSDYEAPQMRAKFSAFHKQKNLLSWLEPPDSFGPLTIHDLWYNQDTKLHYQLAKEWAQSVWDAWSHQHNKIGSLVEQIR